MASAESSKEFQLEFRPPDKEKLGADPGYMVLQEARFDTKLLDKPLWPRIDSIQLKTETTEEYRRAEDDKLLFTWFNIAIHRPWEHSDPYPRLGPRANFTDGGSLRWRSHTNNPKSWHDEKEFGGREFSRDLEFGGRVFTRMDELVKQLEYGDVIVVSLCSRFEAVSCPFLQGELVISLLDEEINRAMASYGRYRYWAPGPCNTTSYDHTIASEIWFSTPALDKDTLSKLHSVQLFTESQDQGWVSDPRSASYSWFDLVILASPDDKEPRVVDGLELAWRSHSNRVGAEGYEVLDGFMFHCTHDLIQLLEPGNAVAARVSCRFGAWENRANDGCIELKFTDTEIKRGPVKPQDSLVTAAKLKHMLAEYIASLKQNEGEAGVELDPVVLDLLKMPTSWDQAGGQKKPELMLLSLDGGGVRGLSALHMLKAIMEQIRVDRGLKEAPKPCDVFDLIVGTSTGGLIALMLARLEMSVDECIKEYESLAIDVFGKKNADRYKTWREKWQELKDKTASYLNLAKSAHMYKATQLESAIKKVVQDKDKTKDPDAKMWSDTKCRAVVVASRTDDISTRPPTHFRTYWMKSGDSPDCTIWEAARATSAAPAYFERIKVQEYEYVDGGLQANNPVIQTLSEGMVVFDNPRPVGCLISLGTGMPPPQALRNNGGLFGNIRSFYSLGGAIVKQLTNSHRAHEDVKGLNFHRTLAEHYYRFNAPLGTNDITGDDPEWESKFVGLDDTSLIPQFQKASEAYMKTNEPQEWAKACAQILGKRLDEQKV